MVSKWAHGELKIPIVGQYSMVKNSYEELLVSTKELVDNQVMNKIFVGKGKYHAARSD